jgi:hypothetical protein
MAWAPCTSRDSFCEILYRMKPVRLAIFLVMLVGGGRCSPAEENWQPAKGPLLTPWARDVSPKNSHPEYPRPQMMRKEWQCLNGLWDYAIRPKDEDAPADFDQPCSDESRCD